MALAQFPNGYGVDVPGGQAGFGDFRSLRALFGLTTVARLHSEFRRRVCALMLYALEQGQPMGIGTGWRSYAAQAAAHAKNPTGATSAGNSNHEGDSDDVDLNAIAIDTVPSAAQKWSTADPAILDRFGLIAFLPSSDPRAWNEVERRSYSTSSTREPWHLQPKEVRYARSGRRTKAALRHWSIDPKYDIEVVGIDDPTGHPLWTGTPVPPPPVVDPSPVNPPVDPNPPTVRRNAVQGTKATLNANNTKALAADPRAKADVVLFQCIVHGLADQYPNVAEFDIGTIDGSYGPRSAGACTMLQRLSGFDPDPAKRLGVDGECGPATWTSLLNLG